TIALALVRAMLGEFAALGLRGFTVFLQDTEAEQKIRTMIAAAGGSEVNYTGVRSSLKFSGQPDAESVPRETIHAVTRPPDVRPAPQPLFIRQVPACCPKSSRQSWGHSEPPAGQSPVVLGPPPAPSADRPRWKARLGQSRRPLLGPCPGSRKGRPQPHRLKPRRRPH